ncbi:hypothetical protein V7S43_008907 [Phytophthora oleae]|uniref:Gamma-glutamylcyclotransferase AIG2-like domain-containing protein n=1 Tax=Phytophthora oleae TaxID=2107226 RepID=A0ABD3FI85_9STRA
MVAIIGFGSLLSEASARSTFGADVRNFRLATVLDYRRVFAHPASIFFQRGIANLETKEIASLSTEPAPGCKFLVSVFDIPSELLPDFYEREEEFKIISAKFQELDGSIGAEALMCTRWSDEKYIVKRGQETFDTKYKTYGLGTIWGWDAKSGILPCRVWQNKLKIFAMICMLNDNYVELIHVLGECPGVPSSLSAGCQEARPERLR